MAKQTRQAVVHANSNDLPKSVKEKVIPLLQARLADAIDLHYQAKQAHWNVKGKHFIALHELFDKVAEQADEHVDLIAERLVMLGGQAHGTIRSAAGRTTLKEYPLDLSHDMDHVREMTRALSEFGKCAREAIDTASEAKDADTADLFTEVSRDTDKNLWFVEAHLQGE